MGRTQPPVAMQAWAKQATLEWQLMNQSPERTWRHEASRRRSTSGATPVAAAKRHVLMAEARVTWWAPLDARRRRNEKHGTYCNHSSLHRSSCRTQDNLHRGRDNRTNIPKRDVDSSDQSSYACRRAAREGGKHTVKSQLGHRQTLSQHRQTPTDTRSQTVAKQTSRSPRRTHIRLRRLAALSMSLSHHRTPRKHTVDPTPETGT